MKQKYTKNGRKVVIIGKLNSTETIVQEICVKEDGSEIPAGEQFVITGPLLDEPVETWQNKQLRELKETIEQSRKKAKELTSKLMDKERRVAAHMKALTALERNAAPEQLEALLAFVSGDIKYIVTIRGGLPEIHLFQERVGKKEEFGGKIELRLVSLFGGSDGHLDWRLSSYSDDSGQWQKFFPATSLNHATEIAQTVYDGLVSEWRNGERKVPPDAAWGRMPDGIVVPEDVSNFWMHRCEQERMEKIDLLQKQLNELLAEGGQIDDARREKESNNAG